MFSIIFTWLIVVWGVLACVYMLHCAWTRFPRRDVDVDDVIPFLYPVDISLAESLLDPAAEFECRWTLGPLQFREAQRKRIRLFLEVTRRMAHNAKVLVEYAHSHSEKNGDDPHRSSLASELQEKAIGVRLYSLLIGVKLRFWLVFHGEIFNTMPVLSHLRTAGEIDGLQTYSALKAAAAAFVQLPPEEVNSLTRNL
jgi:hypothetical protein